MCCASMLCYSCTTDPSSSYATCHFLRAGEYGSNTRDTYMKARRHAEASSPPYSVYTLGCTNTQARADISAAHCAHVFWQPNRACMNNHIGARSLLLLRLHLKHVAQPIKPLPCTYTATLIHTVKKKCLCVTVQQQYFPCSSFWKISLAKATSDLQHNYSKFKARPG